jgi:hypothetical protein
MSPYAWPPAETFRKDHRATDAPPDDQTTNGQRAHLAWTLLELGRYCPKQEGAEALADCLTDLMHVAHREGWDFPAALQRAHRDFEMER